MATSAESERPLIPYERKENADRLIEALWPKFELKFATARFKKMEVEEGWEVYECTFESEIFTYVTYRVGENGENVKHDFSKKDLRIGIETKVTLVNGTSHWLVDYSVKGLDGRPIQDHTNSTSAVSEIQAFVAAY